MCLAILTIIDFAAMELSAGQEQAVLNTLFSVYIDRILHLVIMRQPSELSHGHAAIVQVVS